MALIETLVDAFPSPSLNAAWNATGTVTVDGRLNLEANFANNAHIISATTYTLTGSYAYIKVVNAGTPFYNIFFTPLYLTSGSRDLYWQIYQGFIYAYDGASQLYSAYYDISAMPYLRIREASGTIYFDTSVDGLTWTNRATSTSGSLPVFTIQVLNDWTGTPFLTNTVILDNFNTTATTYTRTISGTILFFGFVDRPEVEHTRTISGTLLFSGFAIGTKQISYADNDRKTYLYKVYSPSNVFLDVLNDVSDEFNYSESINTAGSAVTLELARNSDSLIVDVENILDSSSNSILDNNSQPISSLTESPNQIGDGSIVDYNNRVDVFVFYGYLSPLLDSNSIPILDSSNNEILGTTGAPAGKRIYSGFISDISSRYGSTETTVVTLMSFGWDLDQYVVSSGSTTTVAFNSYDPSTIVKDGLTTFQSVSGSNITYSSNSVENTSTVVSYTFKVNTYLELLKKAVELAPSDWFFYLDQGLQLINFRAQPTTPDHTFHLGQHFESLDLRGNIENAVNDVYFVGGETAGVALFKRTTATPASKTRRGLRKLTDARVFLTDTAALLSQSEIDRYNQLVYRSTIKILDKKYDIESIKLGQLVAFRNFGNYIDGLQLQIMGRNYTPDAVELQLGSLLPNISHRIVDIKRNLEATETATVPTAPS